MGIYTATITGTLVIGPTPAVYRFSVLSVTGSFTVAGTDSYNGATSTPITISAGQAFNVESQPNAPVQATIVVTGSAEIAIFT